jgi:hypothetical protein
LRRPKEERSLIEDAFYYKHIRRFLEYFDRDRILILVYEDLKVDPISFLATIYAFLGVDDSFLPERINEKIHQTRVPKSRLLESLMVRAKYFMRSAELYQLANRFNETGWVQKFKALNTIKNQNNLNIRDDFRSRLADEFAEDKANLARLINRDLSIWK